MGTRGLLILISNGKRRAIYSPTDSQPKGMGMELVQFLLSLTTCELELLIERLAKLKWLDSEDPSLEELRAPYCEKGFGDTRFRNSRSWMTIFYNVLGAKALPKILDGSLDHMVDQIELEDNPDSEWTYEVDLQKETLRTWKGDVEVGFEKFADLSIDYMRELELVNEKKMVKTDEIGDERERAILIFLYYYHIDQV